MNKSIDDSELGLCKPVQETLDNKNPLYIEFNRMLHSNKCIYSYILLIVLSIGIFIYSLVAYLIDLDEFPILVCESILIIFVCSDMAMRIVVNV
jgi:hypothetical protein